MKYLLKILWLFIDWRITTWIFLFIAKNCNMDYFDIVMATMLWVVWEILIWLSKRS